MLTEDLQQKAPSACSRLPPLEDYLAVGRDRGISWTALRQQVLELLWTDGRPSGPYGLADAMRGDGNQIYPTSVYRVLNLLQEAGLVVPITSSRRVQISPDPRQRDWAVLRCSRCEHSALLSLPREADAVRNAARQLGHATDQLVIECVGRCGDCVGATS